mgnify:CR=1 FL=1|tara:strand:+ start:92 stop:844 length:753 start_codon:yes stop_codon:yes gene_type:complete
MKINKQMKSILPLAAICGLTLTFSATNASAALLLTENFSGDGTATLVSATTAEGNDWTGSTAFVNDGTTTNRYQSAYLAIPGGALAQGGIYTLKTTFSVHAANNGEQFKFGFATAAGTGASYPDGSTGYASMGMSTNGAYKWWSDTPITDQSGDGAGTGWAGTVGTIILDTTNALDYTMTLHDANGQRGESYSLGAAPALTHIWIGDNRGNNQGGGYIFDQVQLSNNVPEPTTTALLGLGGLALILRRRK